MFSNVCNFLQQNIHSEANYSTGVLQPLWHLFQIILTCLTSFKGSCNRTGSSEMTSNFISFRGIVVAAISVVLVCRSMSNTLNLSRMFYINKSIVVTIKIPINCSKMNNQRRLNHKFLTLNSDILIWAVNVSLNFGCKLWRTVLVVNSSCTRWVFFLNERPLSFNTLIVTNGSLVVEYSRGGKSPTLWNDWMI